MKIRTNLRISTARTFLLFLFKPSMKIYQAGSSKLENMMGQWESSQLADKSPQWEQPVLFLMLLFIPRARKYPQVPLASLFLSHKSPFPPLKTSLLPPKRPSLSFVVLWNSVFF